MGYKATSYLGWQVPVITDSNHGRASITSVEPGRIQKDLKKGAIVVVAGFQGISDKGRVTTLGRGGSDVTAVALADVLGADICEIFTDLDGIYTADPTICKEARKIDKISYDEMLELASLGEQACGRWNMQSTTTLHYVFDHNSIEMRVPWSLRRMKIWSGLLFPGLFMIRTKPKLRLWEFRISRALQRRF